MTNHPDNCPGCGTNLLGAEIPERPGEHYRREIGMEIPGVYDGVLYWFCPACSFAWPRIFSAYYGTLQERSRQYADTHNARRLQPSG